MDERRKEMAAQFKHSMIRFVRERSLVGFTTDEDIAGALRSTFDLAIMKSDVARWRRQHPAFEHACAYARTEIHTELTTLAVEAARDGDMQMTRWLLERTCPAFMPKSKTELAGHVSTLDETLARRTATEDDLRQRGVLYDAE